jgi:hypothetical protein
MKRRPQSTYASSLLDLAKRAKMENDPVTQMMLFNYGMTGNQHLKMGLEQRLKMQALIEELEPFPFSRIREENIRERISPEQRIQLGQVMNSSVPCFYNYQEFPTHGVILGPTGRGKTNLLLNIFSQCIEKGIPIWIFDKKKDFRRLIKKYPEILVFRASKDLPIGFLDSPPNVPQIDWMAKFFELFCKVHSLLDGSDNLMSAEADELFVKLGSYEPSGVPPSIMDLKNHIEQKDYKRHYRKSQYQESILNRLNKYCRYYPQFVENSVGFPLHELGNKTCIFELDMTEKPNRFFINVLLRWLFEYRMANGIRGASLRTLVFLDEGNTAAPKLNSQDATGFSPISVMYDQGRDFGIGLLLATQSINYLENSVFVNSNLKICFGGGGSGDDIPKIKTVFQLSDEQASFVDNKLQKGQALVKSPSLFTGEPFVIQIPRFNE